MIKNTLSLFVLILTATTFYAQTPFIHNYTPEEYKASGQNWSIVQNQQGIMYFANNNGVLEYDGTSWRTIYTSVYVRSLSIDSLGIIYVGLENDFGYLVSDSIGQLHYASLKDKIPKEHQDVKQIWNIYTIGSKVIFVTSKKLFILENDSIDVLLVNDDIRNDFLVNNILYIQYAEGDLCLLENDSLRPLPGKEKLHNKYILAILPYDNNNLLLVTYKKGIYMYNPNKPSFIWKPKRFKDIDKFLIKNNVLNGTILENGNYAVSSTRNGIIVFDKHGKIHNHYNKQNGLQSNTAYDIFTDTEGQLWIALQNGISLIVDNIPFLKYNGNNGLDGSIYSVQKFNNNLYVGTSNNLYIQNKENNFDLIEGTSGQNFFMIQKNGKLLLGNCPRGIFEINGNKVLKQSAKFKESPSIAFLRLNKHPNYLITQVWNQGLALLEYKNEHWEYKHLIKGFDKNARYIEEAENGDIWVNANSQLNKLRLNKTLDSVIFIKAYNGDKYHLPESFIMPYHLNNGKIIFSTNKGFYHYLPDMDYFEPYPYLPMISKFVFPLIQDKNDNIWFDIADEDNISEKGVLRLINGKYEKNITPFLKFTTNTMPTANAIYPYSDSIVYFGTNKGLLEYHPKQKVNYDISFNTIIRKVLTNDSLLFGGSTSISNNILDNPIILKYNDNNLVFHYSATYYEDSKKNLFSYRLIGSSDTTWSAWTIDRKKEYTNLYEGKYTFEVKSQNIYRKYGHTASFTFEILPPWQRTWLAYILYGLIATIFILIIIRLNSIRLKHHNEILRQIVNDRTADLQASNDKLYLLNSTKDKFFTIISHDLRSPFNSILGFTNLLVNDYDKYDDTQKKKIISSLSKSSQSAFELLDNLLTWSRTQTGRIEINKVPLNIKKLVETSIAPYKYNASKKNIEITTNISPDIELIIDRNTTITIIGNLINNAIKFTPEGGKITISYIENADNTEIHVIDTGVGISPEVIEKLFKTDEDVSTKGTNNEKGTGLGLILCKEFIVKSGGDIYVNSEVGKGSDFIIRFPK